MPPTKPYLQIGSTQIELGNLRVLDEGAHGVAYSVTAQPNSKIDELDKLILDPGSRTFVVKKAKNDDAQKEIEKEAEVSIQISAAITESGKGLEVTRLLNATTSAVLVEEDRPPQTVIVGHEEKIGLTHFLAANKDLSAAQKIKMLTDIMKQQWDAVQLFHWGLKPHYFVHGDIAMRNFLVSADGQIKLADFGTAQAVSADVRDFAQIDEIGALKWLSADAIQSKVLDRAGDIVSLKITYLEEIAASITGDKLAIWKGEYDLTGSTYAAIKHVENGDNWYLQALYSNLILLINGIENEKDRALYYEFVKSLELVFTSPFMTAEGQKIYAQQQLDKGLSATRAKFEIQNAPKAPVRYEPLPKKVEEDKPENAYDSFNLNSRAREKPTPVDEQSIRNNPEEWSKIPSQPRKTEIKIGSQRTTNEVDVSNQLPTDDIGSQQTANDDYAGLPPKTDTPYFDSNVTTTLGSHRTKRQDSDDYGSLPAQKSDFGDYGALPKFEVPNSQATTTNIQGSGSFPSSNQTTKDVPSDYGYLPITPALTNPTPPNNPPTAKPTSPREPQSSTYAVTQKMQMEAKKNSHVPPAQAPRINRQTDADKKVQPVSGIKVSERIKQFEKMGQSTATKPVQLSSKGSKQESKETTKIEPPITTRRHP